MAKDAELPNIPEHSPITRRKQFQVKNSLKQEKDDKKEKAKAKAKAKASAGPKARGRPKKDTQEVEETVSEKKRLAKQARKKKVKAMRRANKRKEKAKRVAAAKAKANQKQSDKPTLEQKDAGKVKGSKRKAQESKNDTRKTKDDNKKDDNKKEKGNSKKVGGAKTKDLSQPQPAQVDEDVKTQLLSILGECEGGGECGECHSDWVKNLQWCPNQTYRFSNYWSRNSVGLVCKKELLPEEFQKSSKSADQEIKYFGGGDCIFVNMAMMTDLVTS